MGHRNLGRRGIYAFDHLMGKSREKDLAACCQECEWCEDDKDLSLVESECMPNSDDIVNIKAFK
jgi:hypothetical protein